MGVIATLEHQRLHVEPGGETTCELRLHNTGSVVDQFTVDVLGDAQDWATISPTVVNVFPQQDAIVELVFATPRSADVPMGEVSFAVRVMSREDTDGSTVQEGVIEVGGFTEPSVELAPRTVRGRRTGRCRIVVTNNGNAPLDTRLSAVDPHDQLSFRVAQRRVTTAPGTSTLVRLRTRPHKLLLRGAPRILPFQVAARDLDGETLTADGVMTQLPLVPRTLPRILAIAVAAVAALVILWQLALKPVVESQAGEAAVDRANELAASAEKAQKSAEQASRKADKAAANAVGADQEASGQYPALAGTSEHGTQAGPLKAVDFRIQADAGTSHEFDEFSHTVPKDQTVYVSDIYLGNPFGDSGVVQLRRNDAVLIEVDLRNFRDQDYHFIQPLEFQAGQKVVLAVQCTKPGTAPAGSEAGSCSPAGYFSGRAVVRTR